MGAVLFILLLAAIAAAPFVAERLRKPMTGAAMDAGPGQIAPLRAAPTHYRWDGPVGGPVAVCVHGLTTPSPVFDALAGHLTGAGYRVLTYDLPGRGFSGDAAGVAQGPRFFTGQLEDLLAQQGIDTVDLLIGYSMGGAIATCFAARWPERVERLILLAPAGLFHNAGALAEFCTRTPVLGDWLMLTFGGAVMRRRLRAEPDDDLREVQLAQTRRRGFLPAVLSSQRNMLNRNLRAEHREIRAMQVATLAIWGEEDRVIPMSNVGRLAEVNREARQSTIPGATHALPHSHAPETMREIAAFVAETSGPPVSGA